MTSDRGHHHQLDATYPSSFQSSTSCSGACGKSQSGAGFACDAARAPSETLGTCTGRTETASPWCECSGDGAVGSHSQSQNCTSETQKHEHHQLSQLSTKLHIRNMKQEHKLHQLSKSITKEYSETHI